MSNNTTLIDIHSLPNDWRDRIIKEYCQLVQFVITPEIYAETEKLFLKHSVQCLHTVLFVTNSKTVDKSIDLLEKSDVTGINRAFRDELLKKIRISSLGNNIQEIYYEPVINEIINRITGHLEIRKTSYVRGAQFSISSPFRVDDLCILVLGSVGYDLSVKKRFRLFGNNIVKWNVRVNLYIVVVDKKIVPIRMDRGDDPYKWVMATVNN